MDEKKVREVATLIRGGKAGVPAGLAASCLPLLVIAFVLVAGLVATLTRIYGLKEGILVPGAIVGAIILALIVFFARLRIAASFYEVRPAEAPTALTPGESFRWGAVVEPKRRMKLGRAKVVLRCQEHAINRGGTSDSHYRKTILEETLDLGEERQLALGGIAEFETEITIPQTAIPSYSGKNNRIEWDLILTAPVPGYCPDIKEEVSLRVLPQIGDEFARGEAMDAAIPADWSPPEEMREGRREQGGVRAELRVVDGATIQGLPAIPVGETRRLDLSVHTDTEFHCRGVLCWVGCRMHGSGTDEKLDVVPEQFIHEGDFGAGHTISHSLTLAIPQDGPVSFQGRYVKFDWMVRVRVDIPIWRDKYLELPFLVTPRLGA